MKMVFTAVVLASALLAQDAGKPGAKVQSIPVADLTGKPSAIATPGQVTAVVFLSARCPVSGAYNERMEAIYKDYQSRVKFVFINTNSNEPDAEVANHAREHGFTFPVWRDPHNAAADLFAAQVTPETWVIGKDGIIAYHGRIDDAQTEGRVTVKNLRQALDEVLLGGKVSVPEAKACGCTGKRGPKTL